MIEVYMHSTRGTQYIGYLQACVSTVLSLNQVCLIDGIVGIPVIAFLPTQSPTLCSHTSKPTHSLGLGL